MLRVLFFPKYHTRICSFSSSNILHDITIKIGNATKTLTKPQHPELVPIKYLSNNNSKNNQKSLLKHLQWMIQKDSLGQDIFLIGPPGSYRRKLAMSFAELTQREIEFVSLSRDTTESDLKQRREITNTNAVYIDQTALRAATNGRILILDGIEKAERNVLPILNNLLENREMQLEDGRFLMRAELYDQLLMKYSQLELNRWKFIRCNEKFRVIALGLPVPQFKGNPLDPPLRSRFQSRYVAGESYEELLAAVKDKFPSINREKVEKIVSFVLAMRGEQNNIDLPYFPLDNLVDTIGLWDKFPNFNELQLIESICPFELLSTENEKKFIFDMMKKFKIDNTKQNNKLKLSMEKIKNDIVNQFFQQSTNQLEASRISKRIIITPTIDEVMQQLIVSHSIGRDFCLIGPQGCGKSVIVEALASEFRSAVTHVVLYGDMTVRDIVQQRETESDTGDTIWRNSALVRTAIDGGWAVLEGLHRLEKGCMSVLGQLVTDRQLQLFDGTRLIRHDRYDAIKEAEGLTNEEMTKRGIYRIDPNFRIIALADPPLIPGESSKTDSNNKTEWLTPEILTSFRFHILPEMSRVDEKLIVTKSISNMPSMKLDKLLDIVHKLRTSDDPQIRDLSLNLSTRQILRICHRLTKYPSENLLSSIHKACLSKFLPKLVQESLFQSLEEFQNFDQSKEINKLSESEQLQKLIDEYKVTMHPNKGGSVAGEDEAKVPNVLFYDSIAHTRILLEMLQDFMIGESFKDQQHLLLIGNQGVGKNKIVDRFLQLLNRPREYIQLHRDTTVQNLTLQPTIINGRLVYEDSALVKAISKGRILVIDEADKASTQVTCILKTLVSLGEMELSDGRRIVPNNFDVSHLSLEQLQKIIRIHPDFRMIVLANRPGFPFLGNDFFGAMGDVFSCHAVDNPDVVSEIIMLQKYGPSVPIDTIKKLVFLFSDLRELVDKGQINYPYSTREIVNIVRHLEKYPNDALSFVLGNVFDFDASNKEMLSVIENVLEKHGISLPGTKVRVAIAKEFPLPEIVNIGHWNADWYSLKNVKVLYHSGVEKLSDVSEPTRLNVESHITRSRTFAELNECISIKLGEYNIISDMIISDVVGHPNSYIHFVTLNPIALTSLIVSKDAQGNCNRLTTCNYATRIDLSDMFPQVQGSFRPIIQLAALPSPYENQVLLFEASTNKLLQINIDSGEILQMLCDCLPENKFKLKPMWFSLANESRTQNGCMKLLKNWSSHPSEPSVIFYKSGEEYFRLYDILKKSWCTLYPGFPIKTISLNNVDQWLIQDQESKLHLIACNDVHNSAYTIMNININSHPFNTCNIFTDAMNTGDFHHLISERIGSMDVKVGKSVDSYVDIFPYSFTNKEHKLSVSKIPRQNPVSAICCHSSTSAVIPSSGIVANLVEKAAIPKNSIQSTGYNYTSINGYLEIVNLKSKSLKYLPITSVYEEPRTFQWLKTNNPDVFIGRLRNDVITMDNTGCICKWTVCPVQLSSELLEWKSTIGIGNENDRDLMIERLDSEVNTNLSDPKHGKVDPSGAQHVGGNTWAGGSGGRDTAGLGGIGGPYRLDGGNDVFQVSDSIKASVPDHVKAAAREVAKKAWKERLDNIHMSELDYDLYMRYFKRVEPQIIAIRSILDTLQATSKERQWIRHRTHGDLDDGKLVEGVLGEKSIYRARGEKDPEPGSPQIKPKRLRVICDLSGSMYRFNGHDQRLERQSEAILMLMESFSNVSSNKLKYEIYGHSGEGAQFPFVKLNQSPTNEKERMNVLGEMVAHSQFCLSGDHTLEAISAGIADLKRTIDSYDQSFMIVLSDANLSRYGISPNSVAKLLLKDKDIYSFIVFIGSLGDQAQFLKKSLPIGHAFVCMDIETLPQILRHIFTTNLL